MTTTLTAKELAQALDTDPRTVRRFLRSAQGTDSTVGKGHRWVIEAKQVRSLKSRFAKWVIADADAKAARKAAANAAPEVNEAPEGDEVEEIELDA